MNKLKDLRDELAHYGEDKLLNDPIDEAFTKGFQEGWDSYEELDLPVKFGAWLSKEYNPSDGINWWHDHEGGEDKTTEELYKYWIENIYKPE